MHQSDSFVSLLPLIHLGLPQEKLPQTGCSESCVLLSKAKLSKGIGSCIPSFQTHHDVSKPKEWNSFKIPLKSLHSKQALGFFGSHYSEM
jgi:hypothetical protein